jgi:hypothetical protein
MLITVRITLFTFFQLFMNTSHCPTNPTDCFIKNEEALYCSVPCNTKVGLVLRQYGSCFYPTQIGGT